MTAAAPSPPPPTTIADYRLLARLQDGGAAVLYRAEAPARLQLPAGTTVVVKLLEGTGERAFSRLSRLLQTFAAVNSPQLAPLLDAGQHEDVFFYTTPDWPLGTLALPASTVEADHAVAAVADACRAAHALHEAGITHRDISPSAVLLREHGGWLGGLDLARAAMAGGSVTSMASLHSVGYVDPACIRGDPPSRATDIYSLGATLHFAMTGRPLHPDLPVGDPVLAVRRVLRDPPRLSEQLNDDAAEIVRACVDPDPSARPATAADLAAWIDGMTDALATDDTGPEGAR